MAHASALESIRFFVALLGVFYAAVLTRDGYYDVKWLKAHDINHLRLYSAKTSLYFFATICFTQIIFSTTGLIGIITGVNAHAVSQSLFITGEAVLVLGTYFKNRRRIRLNKMIRADDKIRNLHDDHRTADAEVG